MNGYRCPRCGNGKIIDYGDTFDCSVCELEFKKNDLNTIEDKSSILAIEEKMGVIKEFI